MLPLLVSLAAVPFLTVQQSFVKTTGSVPLGAQRVPVLELTLSASCGADLPVQSVTLSHAGLGNPADIARVYLLRSGQRISRSSVPDARDGHVTVRLRSFVIPSCGKQMLTVAADMTPDAAAGGEHRFVLRQHADVIAGPGVAVRLEQASVSAAILRTVGPAQGSLTAVFLSNLLPVSYGADRTLARFRLSADGRDDQRITAITLVNEGTARSIDLQNLFLAGNDRRQLTGVLPSMDHDRVRLVFDPPLIIGKNERRILSLHGDVRAGRRKTIEWTVQETSDIEADAVQGRTPFAP